MKCEDFYFISNMKLLTMLMSTTDFAFCNLLGQETDVPCTSVQILLSYFSHKKMYVWQLKSGQ